MTEFNIYCACVTFIHIFLRFLKTSFRVLPEERSVEEKFENQRRRDLIWNICYTDIKEWKLGFDDITDHDTQFRLPVGALHSLL